MLNKPLWDDRRFTDAHAFQANNCPELLVELDVDGTKNLLYYITLADIIHTAYIRYCSLYTVFALASKTELVSVS